jgi:hypothetical protein
MAKFTEQSRKLHLDFLLPGLLLLAWGSPPSLHAQPPIVLRDLSVISDASVTEFDEHSIQLSDGRSLGWDEILSATVPLDQQSQFNESLLQIGLPLFRLKSRVEREDWAGACELAESCFASLKFNRLDCDDPSTTTYLVCVATMKGRLLRGDRTGAVVPFLIAAKIQRGWSDSPVGKFPKWLPEEDVAASLSSEILPIWFEPELVNSSFQILSLALAQTTTADEMGAIVYLASMSIELGRLNQARELMAILANGGRTWDAWRLILQAQFNIAEGNPAVAAELLKSETIRLSGATEAIGWYLKSAAIFMENNLKPDSKSASTALLDLLKIPAVYGQRFPPLSAAALFQSIRIAESQAWHAEAEILRRELLNRYPNSYHAELAKKM